MALVGDRERERAVALLKGHYLRGRLSLEELTDRLEVALAARRESEVRLALAGLPAAWREQAIGARSTISRAVGRAVFVVAVWSLWWLASLVLLIGFVAGVLLQGVTVTTALIFPALWLVCTVVAGRVVRRSPPTRHIGR
jgi:Domain of unknown function (DUF1707)